MRALPIRLVMYVQTVEKHQPKETGRGSKWEHELYSTSSKKKATTSAFTHIGER
jgi:hypothetical protein